MQLLLPGKAEINVSLPSPQLGSVNRKWRLDESCRFLGTSVFCSAEAWDFPSLLGAWCNGCLVARWCVVHPLLNGLRWASRESNISRVRSGAQNLKISFGCRRYWWSFPPPQGTDEDFVEDPQAEGWKGHSGAPPLAKWDFGLRARSVCVLLRRWAFVKLCGFDR